MRRASQRLFSQTFRRVVQERPPLPDPTIERPVRIPERDLDKQIADQRKKEALDQMLEQWRSKPISHEENSGDPRTVRPC